MKSILYPIERRLIIMRFERELQSIIMEMKTNTNGFRAMGLMVSANALLMWFRSALSSLNRPYPTGGVMCKASSLKCIPLPDEGAKVVSVDDRPFSASRLVKIQMDKGDKEFARKLRESLAGGV